MSDPDPYYNLSEEQKQSYLQTALLCHLAQPSTTLKNTLIGQDRQLKPALDFLAEKKYISCTDEGNFTLTKAGRNRLEDFEKRYQSYLTYFDIYAFVDIMEGDLAYAHYPSFERESDWENFIQEGRWTDLRVAMIDYLDGKPAELIFAQLLLENQIDTTKYGWQNYLCKGQLWQQIKDLCDASVQEEDLDFEEVGVSDSDIRQVSGEEVLEAICDDALEQMHHLYAEDAEIVSHLNAWFPEDNPKKRSGYGAAMANQKSKTPFWEQPWTP